MSQITASHLQAGIIFGDRLAGEYVYMPAGEVGVSEPLCVFENSKERRDLSLAAAAALVQKLSLRPVRHPRFGLRSY
ncbi:hypothetical protein AXX12_09255 [Anaerosporomusa subterranea]|uniref:Uncharacterized protein n=1 Tax=Anaerosporomusa subterranea TaxID=1794912 RepID=A0A154BRN1_ANASB|nr:hypothetical protein [Anaerosporomusa subterranea]KYZ76606.1 hypothetical protein AXX12_09255 [Anaerosporomusa subterranea]